MFSSPELNLNQINITPGMTVADLGAGVGAYSIAAAKLVEKHGKVIAVDVQKEMLGRLAQEAAHAGYTNVTTLWADIETPHGSRLADNLADRVLISNVLFLAEDKAAIMKEAARICKSGGFVLVIDWSESFGGMGPTPEMIVKRETISELAEANGLDFSKEIEAGEHHYGLLFKKP
jgi:ubiquinone/menaquinone biosynthesis C-methylase UbiE